MLSLAVAAFLLGLVTTSALRARADGGGGSPGGGELCAHESPEWFTVDVTQVLVDGNPATIERVPLALRDAYPGSPIASTP